MEGSQRKGLEGLRVVVVGGSMGGSIITILLLRAGAKVKMLERSTLSTMEKRGAGLGLPLPFLDTLIKDGILDTKLPVQEAFSLEMIGSAPSDPVFARYGKTVWAQRANIAMISWPALAHCLRSQIPEGVAEYHKNVVKVEQTESEATVICEDGSSYKCDLVVGADGYHSSTRKILFPNAEPEYGKHVLWRGVTPEAALKKDKGPLLGKLNFVKLHNKRGLFSSFFVPNFQDPSKKDVTWVVFLPQEGEELKDLMTGANGVHYNGFLPPGAVRPEIDAHLKRTIGESLPKYFSDVIHNSTTSFIQMVFTLELPSLHSGRIALISEAGVIASPHTASGVLKAYGNAKTLVESLHSVDIKNSSELNRALEKWSEMEVKMGRSKVNLGKQLGDAMVLNTPDWFNMDEHQMRTWWERNITTQHDAILPSRL